MALPSRLAQLQAKACEATRFAAKRGCAYQRSLVEKNKKYVVEPPTIEKCQELSKQLFYTRLARSVICSLSWTPESLASIGFWDARLFPDVCVVASGQLAVDRRASLPNLASNWNNLDCRWMCL